MAAISDRTSDTSVSILSIRASRVSGAMRGGQVTDQIDRTALTVLDEIKSFPSITLRAMCRKLEGDRGHCTANEPAEQLAGALGVAGLTLKLVMNRPAVRDFRRFSPEMEALHNDIGKAHHLLKEVSLTDLKKVLHLLDPKFKLFVKGSRPVLSVRKLLIEYLYECSEMDTVPGVLIETLGIINGRAQRRSCKKSSTSNVFSSSRESVKEEIEKEIEHVLNISAQAKEVVANLLPEHEFDEEFADAYMEDFEESDTSCVFDDDQRFAFRSYSSHDQTESTGEIDPVKFNSSVSARCTSEEFGSAYSDFVKMTTKPSMPRVSRSRAKKSSHNDVKSEETTSCSPSTTKNGGSDFQEEETDIVHQQSRSANEYLDLQEACDNTSMVAYHFIGYMLDTLAMTEGLGLSQDNRLYLQNYTSVPQVTQEFSDTLVSKFSEIWKKCA
ncbi:hypothetical protein C2S51_021830 [Perilla frutescens var. frutescens]|nr:hypothetical protein C2S51_021830 [Perilla frutescens var. frutescens]